MPLQFIVVYNEMLAYATSDYMLLEFWKQRQRLTTLEVVIGKTVLGNFIVVMLEVQPNTK